MHRIATREHWRMRVHGLHFPARSVSVHIVLPGISCGFSYHCWSCLPSYEARTERAEAFPHHARLKYSYGSDGLPALEKCLRRVTTQCRVCLFLTLEELCSIEMNIFYPIKDQRDTSQSISCILDISFLNP